MRRYASPSLSFLSSLVAALCLLAVSSYFSSSGEERALMFVFSGLVVLVVALGKWSRCRGFVFALLLRLPSAGPRTGCPSSRLKARLLSLLLDHPAGMASICPRFPRPVSHGTIPGRRKLLLRTRGRRRAACASVVGASIPP